ALVERYHGRRVAETERLWFEQTFSKREIPEDIPTVEVFETDTVLDVLQRCVSSKSSKGNLRRLLLQRAVRLNQEKVLTIKDADKPAIGQILEGDTLRLGRRLFFRAARK